MTDRFIKFIPSEKASYLRSNYPFAFLLLQLVAERARRTLNDPSGLQIGEAYIGDHKSFGATRQQYRTALKHLVDKQFLQIIENCRTRKKSTTGSTTIGTKVKLIDNTIWDINLDYEKVESTTGSTTAQPPTNHRPTTNKKDKKDKKEKNNNPQPPKGDCVVFSCLKNFNCSGLTEKRKIAISQRYQDREQIVMNAILAVTHKNFFPQDTLLKSFNAALKQEWLPPKEKPKEEYIQKDREKIISENRMLSIEIIEKNKEFFDDDFGITMRKDCLEIKTTKNKKVYFESLGYLEADFIKKLKYFIKKFSKPKVGIA